MAKERVEVPSEVAAAVLYASDRTCCVCEERRARVQIHHIDEDPRNNDANNLAVLCLTCHDDTQQRGGFSRKLSPAQVRVFREAWLVRVARRREAADAMIVSRAVHGGERRPPLEAQRGVSREKAFYEEIQAFIDTLPDILATAYDKARDAWVTGVTFEVIRATYEVTEVVRQMWLRLAAYFPERHFGGHTPEEFITDYITQRFEWHSALAEPGGSGTGGTIVRVLVPRGVLRDLETTVVDTATALRGLGYNSKAHDEWLGRWRNVQQRRIGWPTL